VDAIVWNGELALLGMIRRQTRPLAAGSASDTNVRICFGSATKEEIDEGFERIKAFVG
jgi:DNA-binding transcriptional MocR family regulator